MKVILSAALIALLAVVSLSAGCKKSAQTENGISVSQAPADHSNAVTLTPTSDTPATAGEAAKAGEVCAECGKPEADCVCDHSTEATKAACTDPNCKDCPPKAGEPATAAAATTADGIRLVDATVLDTSPAAYAGRIAIHGKVGEVLADKGVFTLVDLKKMPGCKDGCCPKTDIPLRVPSSAYSGTMPKPEDEVIVVGNLTTTPAGGYQIAVEEVRQGDKAILKKGASESKPA